MIQLAREISRTARQLPALAGLRYGAGCRLPGCCADPWGSLGDIRVLSVWLTSLQLARGIHPGDHKACYQGKILEDCRGRLPGHPYSWLLISAALEGDHRRGSAWQDPGLLQGDDQFRQLTNGKTYTVNTVKFLLPAMAVSRRRIFFNCSLQLAREIHPGDHRHEVPGRIPEDHRDISL